MAEIVLGIGTSHSPLLILEGEDWTVRSKADMNNRGLNTLDGRRVSYQTLLAERGEPYATQSDPARFPELAARAEQALDRLVEALQRARPDVVVVIGDDQGEMYDADGMPAISIFTGEELVMKDRGKTQLSNVPMVTVNYWAGYRMDMPHRYPGAPALGRQLAAGLIAREVDIGITSRIRHPERYAFGHAYGFVIARLLKDADVPMLPILVNTYFPPNTPTAARCHAVGRKIADTLKTADGDARIAIIASGGLSHFLCEEAFDREVFAALQHHDWRKLVALPEQALIEGTSEIKNWIMMSAATEHLKFSYGDYIPVHRTPVGTGIGLGFAVWN